MSAGKIFAIFGITGAFFGAMLAVAAVGFHNTEVALKTQYEAKTDANRADFDNTWKTIAQVAQVPQQYKTDFQEIFVGIMDARYQQAAGDGTLMRWIHEQNPSFDSSLYGKIQTVVESKREAWTTRQKELRDVKREHDQLLRQFPGAFYNIFLARDELPVVLVTSDKTEDAFTTGADEDVDLFN
jgi:hypothetical protein